MGENEEGKMTKRKGILGLVKEINSATKVLTGHDIKFHAKVGWEFKGKEMAEGLLARLVKGPGGDAQVAGDWRYEVLKIKPDDTNMVVKLAWRARSAATHPDVGGDIEEHKKVNDAYDKICEERKIHT